MLPLALSSAYGKTPGNPGVLRELFKVKQLGERR